MDKKKNGEPMGEALWVRSMYGANTRKGLVVLQVGREERTMTPDEARALAANLVAGAAAAEGDEYLMHFLQHRVGMQPREGAQVLADFRAFRDAKTGGE